MSVLHAENTTEHARSRGVCVCVCVCVGVCVCGGGGWGERESLPINVKNNRLVAQTIKFLGPTANITRKYPTRHFLSFLLHKKAHRMAYRFATLNG